MMNVYQSIMDMRLNRIIRWHNKPEPRVHVRKVKEEECQSMVKDKVIEAEWKYRDVNEHWQQMKNIIMETAQVTCGLSSNLNDPSHQNENFRIAKQVVKERHDITGSNSLKGV